MGEVRASIQVAMQHILRHSVEWSDWQAASARRLNISMLLATLLVAALLSVLRFPTVEILSPLVELVVDIVHVDEPATEIAPVQEAVVETTPQTEDPVAEIAPALATAEEAVPQTEDPPAEAQATSVAVAELSVDWETEKVDAVQNAIDEMEKTVSVNPKFDERRREAAVKFRPSEAPVRKEIWDNVEKDQMGRTILRNGNCYRVIDDPSVANRWAFENFDQYITYCTYRKYVGKELPWVDEVRARHAYLREREDRRNGIFKQD